MSGRYRMIIELDHILARVGSFNPFFLEFLDFFFLIENWNLFALQSILHFLPEAFDPPAQQVHIVVALLEEVIHVLDSPLLVEMVQNYYFILLVFVLEQLGNDLVLLDAGAREIKGFFNVVLLVLVGVPQVEQQEVGLDAHRQLLGLDRNRSQVGHLTSGIVLMVDVVDGLRLDFLIQHLPQSTGFYPPKEFPLSLGHFFIA